MTGTTADGLIQYVKEGKERRDQFFPDCSKIIYKLTQLETNRRLLCGLSLHLRATDGQQPKHRQTRSRCLNVDMYRPQESR